MNILVWLIIGGLIGWLASVFMGTDGRQGIILNVAVGIIGAALGGWLFGSAFGTSTINEGNLSLSAILVSLIGAVILIAGMKLVRRV
ncbi:MAG: GlsB/YeaQ/YmgE family stress response membrane protein [Woeseia sp.]